MIKKEGKMQTEYLVEEGIFRLFQSEIIGKLEGILGQKITQYTVRGGFDSQKWLIKTASGEAWRVDAAAGQDSKIVYAKPLI